MKTIVIGHKNPDTDSICSAIGYANFKNRVTGTNDYVPMRAGEASAETRFVLERFGAEVPEYIGDIGMQISDVELHTVPGISKDMTINNAWKTMGRNSAATQPVTDDSGKIVGLITKGGIAESLMNVQDCSFLSTTRPRYEDIADTIAGAVIAGDPNARFEKGRVLVGAASADTMQEAIAEGDLIMVVDRGESQRIALESGAGCLILCLGAKADEEILELAEKKGAVIIETLVDTYTAAREINKAVPVRSFMVTDGIVSFKMDDFIEDVRDRMTKVRHRAFPVTDDDGNYIGIISTGSLLKQHKKQVILVDHNEQSQAVDNINEAEILEIVDHHRIGTLQTLEPIYFVNQPVGCTATIIYQMYEDKRVEIDQQTAGLLMAAIISDTLMFRSPTCTVQDKMAAGALALIADVSIEQFATEMFEAGSDLADKSAEEIFYQDYKKFSFAGKDFGVGQISSMSADELTAIRKRVEPLLARECGKNGITMVFFLLTNIRDTSSEIICYGENSDELIKCSFKEYEERDGAYLVDKLMSRKKQLIPAFMKGIASL